MTRKKPLSRFSLMVSLTDSLSHVLHLHPTKPLNKISTVNLCSQSKQISSKSQLILSKSLSKIIPPNPSLIILYENPCKKSKSGFHHLPLFIILPLFRKTPNSQSFSQTPSPNLQSPLSQIPYPTPNYDFFPPQNKTLRFPLILPPYPVTLLLLFLEIIQTTLHHGLYPLPILYQSYSPNPLIKSSLYHLQFHSPIYNLHPPLYSSRYLTRPTMDDQISIAIAQMTLGASDPPTTISEHAQSQALHLTQTSLVVRRLHHIQNAHLLKDLLVDLWKLRYKSAVTIQEDGTLLARFSNEVRLMDVYTNQPWLYKGYLLAIDFWSNHFHEHFLEDVFVWVKVLNVSMEYRHRAALLDLGDKIGESVDYKTRQSYFHGVRAVRVLLLFFFHKYKDYFLY